MAAHYHRVNVYETHNAYSCSRARWPKDTPEEMSTQVEKGLLFQLVCFAVLACNACRLIAALFPGSQHGMGYKRLHQSPPCQVFPTPSTTSLSKFFRESLPALPSHVNPTRILSSNWSPNGSLSHTCAVSGVPSLSTTTYFGEPSPLTYRQSGSGLS